MNYGADVNAGEFGWTPLSNAARYGVSDTVALLLEHGADTVTDYGHTQYLFTAIESGEPDVVALLPEYGVGIDAKDGNGLTACQFASG